MFGKKLKKVVGMILNVGIMTLAMSSVTLPVRAETAVVGTSAVLFQETFDNGIDGIVSDYTADADAKYYSKTDNNGTFSVKKADKINSEFNGNPGIGARVGAWATEMEYTLTDSIGEGTVALSFDISRMDREIEKGSESYVAVNLENSSNSVYQNQSYWYDIYSSAASLKIYGPNDNFTRYGNSSASTEYELNKKHNIVQIINFDKQKVYTYVDCELLSEKNYTEEYKLKGFYFKLSQGIAYFDNLRIQYMAKGDNVFTTSIESSNSESVTVKLSDPVEKSAINKNSFTVKSADNSDVEIESINLVDSYTAKINFKNNIEPGTYTVTANAISNKLGASASTAPMSFVVWNKVLYYETFDNGAEGITAENSGYTKETLTIAENGKTVTRDYYTKESANGIGKMALYLSDSKNGSEWCTSEFDGNTGFSVRKTAGGTRSFYEFNEAINSGVLSYSFDVSRLNRSDEVETTDANYIAVGQTPFSRLNQGTLWGDSTDNLNQRYTMYLDYKQAHSGTEKTGFYGPNANLTNWGNHNTCTGEYNTNQVYHINQIFDLNNRKCYTYVDGTEITGGGVDITAEQKIKTLDIYISKYMTYFDNFKIQYMSNSGESFGVTTDDTVANGATSINVKFDDPVAKEQITADKFTLKAADNTAVNITDAQWVDPYTAKLTFETLNSGNYTVLAQNIKTAAGAAVSDRVRSFRVKSDGIYMNGYTENNGEYSVSLINDSDSPKGAVLLAGVFKDGALIEYASSDKFVNADATALNGGASDELKVTLTKMNVEGAEVKVFLWDSLGTAKPIFGQLNK